MKSATTGIKTNSLGREAVEVTPGMFGTRQQMLFPPKLEAVQLSPQVYSSGENYCVKPTQVRLGE